MSVDIVSLIESNPITKLDGNYQSKLIEKVKNNFSNYEQQMFLSSFYCYLKYDTKNDYVINLDNIWQWLGFQQKYHAKNLLQKHFVVNKDYKFLVTQTGEQSFAPEVAGAKKENRGGHNKDIIMLNIETFKKFCLKAGTKKADEVHDYFIKLENIMFEVTKEECNELKLQIQQVEDIAKKEYEIKLKQQQILDREQILVKEFATSGSLFYIIKIKTLENGHYIVKVGESRRGVLDRYKEHKSKYDECLLLDCFSVNRSKDFETFIKEHNQIRPNKVTDLAGHEKEQELFLVGKNLTYKMLLDIVNQNIKYFNDDGAYKLELENQNLKLMLEMKQDNNSNILIQELTKTIGLLNSKIDNLEKQNKEILEKLNTQQIKTTTGFNQQLATIGPRLQKINPETNQLIKVYETVTEAMNENKNIKRPTIMKAIQENTVYCGYRWLLVERNLDPNIIHNIEPTKVTKIQNLGYIAKLNSDKTKILNVYLDRKTASLENEHKSSSALDNPVKNNTLANGFYYCLYNNCDDKLTTNYENINGKPVLYKKGVGQFNEANELVNEFTCKYDCIKSLNMSDKTLAKTLNKNIKYNGYYYKSLGSKLYI